MKIYNKPELEIKKFEVEDIITTSGADIPALAADLDGGVVEFNQDWVQSEPTSVAELL